MARLVDCVRLPRDIPIECLSIANIPSGDWEVSADTNVAMLKRRFPDAKLTIRPLGALQVAPGMTANEVLRDKNRLMKLATVRQHLDDFNDCRLVFTGMGSSEDKHTENMIRAMGLPKTVWEGVTGDLSYNLVYHQDPVFRAKCPLNARLISVHMDTLKNICSKQDTLVVVVAWGALKAKPILDAYRASVFNALAIEMDLAKSLLQLLDEGYLFSSKEMEVLYESEQVGGSFPMPPRIAASLGMLIQHDGSRRHRAKALFATTRCRPS